jgi:hypothetical protein
MEVELVPWILRVNLFCRPIHTRHFQDEVPINPAKFCAADLVAADAGIRRCQDGNVRDDHQRTAVAKSNRHSLG